MKKVLLALSGGIDSTVVLSMLLEKGYEVTPITFSYGSKHNEYENAAVVKIAKHYHLAEPACIDLGLVMQHFDSDLLKSGGAIPEGHYEDESMRRTVVPSRNMIFLSILAGVAESKGIKELALGVHQGDHFIYPDCRPYFIQSMQHTIELASGGKVHTIHAPILFWDKAQIVKEGIKLHVPFELTRTCYKDQPIACGKCGSCMERLEAFAANGIEDPIPYVK